MCTGWTDSSALIKPSHISAKNGCFQINSLHCYSFQECYLYTLCELDLWLSFSFFLCFSSPSSSENRKNTIILNEKYKWRFRYDYEIIFSTVLKDTVLLALCFSTIYFAINKIYFKKHEKQILEHYIGAFFILHYIYEKIHRCGRES